MSEPTREERIIAVARTLTEDVTLEALEPEVGREKFGRTGLYTQHGCKSDVAVCGPDGWAHCCCFLQACAVVDALDALEGYVLYEFTDDGVKTTFVDAQRPESGDSEHPDA